MGLDYKDAFCVEKLLLGSIKINFNKRSYKQSRQKDWFRSHSKIKI